MMINTTNNTITAKNETAKKAYIAPDVTESPVGRLEGIFASADDCPEGTYSWNPSGNTMKTECKNGWGGIF